MRKALFILGKLADTDLQWILDAGEPRRVRRGETLIAPDRPIDSIFIIIDGEFSIATSNTVVARLGTGEVVGEMSMVDSRPPRADVTAMTDSLVFAVPQHLLRSKLKADTSFSSRFYHALCMFLVGRLDRTDAMVGLGARVAPETPAPAADAIAADAMESVFLAGTRFDWFLERARGH